ncbi:MAG: enoyl-CoA hydratase/isomerase family protein [Anaerovoracaceae bacterium]|jgi:enoyl-CoA hydratase
MKEIIYEKKGHTAIITFNKPMTMNALCETFMAKIDAAIDEAENDEDVYTLIFTGNGRAFIAGADINEMYPKDHKEIYRWALPGARLNMRIEELEKPTIAAINGFALGGGLELAMACDIRIASSSAKLGLVETSLGVICGAGGTQRLPRLVGKAKAKEIIFTASKIKADEACEIGLVNKVVEPDQLMDSALEMAHAIEKNSQVSVRLAKKAINYSDNSNIKDGTIYERELFAETFKHEDQKIGMGGFLQKEKDIKFKNK